MVCFGWRLVAREDRAYAGDVLTERVVVDHEERAPERVAVLTFERAPNPRLRVIEADFWSPTIVPGWLDTVGSLARWAALSFPIMVAMWLLVIYATKYGNPTAHATFVSLFVGPLVGGWLVALATLGAQAWYVRQLEGPWRARTVARRRAAAVRAAERLLGR